MLFLALKKVQIIKITPFQILTTRQTTPLKKSAHFYMDMNYFGLVRVISSWLKMSSIAVDSFALMVLDGFGLLQLVSGSFGWFRIVCCFSRYDLRC